MLVPQEGGLTRKKALKYIYQPRRNLHDEYIVLYRELRLNVRALGVYWRYIIRSNKEPRSSDRTIPPGLFVLYIEHFFPTTFYILFIAHSNLADRCHIKLRRAASSAVKSTLVVYDIIQILFESSALITFYIAATLFIVVMGEPPQMAMSMSDVTSETDPNAAYNEKVADAAREMISPFIAGFFQGFIEVAKTYYAEKKAAKAAAKALAEEIEEAECQQRQNALDSSEGAVWIGIGGECEPVE